MENTEAYKRARQKARLLKDLYSHLSTYLIVNGILFLVNYLGSPGDWWVLFPVIGWGICLTLHTIDTLIKITQIWDKWIDRKTEGIMRNYRDV